MVDWCTGTGCATGAAASGPADAAEVDAAYYRWLTSAGWPQATPDTERRILAELAV